MKLNRFWKFEGSVAPLKIALSMALATLSTFCGAPGGNSGRSARRIARSETRRRIVAQYSLVTAEEEDRIGELPVHRRGGQDRVGVANNGVAAGGINLALAHRSIVAVPVTLAPLTLAPLIVTM